MGRRQNQVEFATELVDPQDATIIKRISSGYFKWPKCLAREDLRSVKALLKTMLAPSVHARFCSWKDVQRQEWLAKVNWVAMMARKIKPPWVPTLSCEGDVRY